MSQTVNPWSPVPLPALNGGLFTGEKFEDGAPWATVPVRPTSAFMNHMTLRSANPPPQAIYQMQAGYRPGNNTDDSMPGVMAFTGSEGFGPFDFACIPCVKESKPQPQTCRPCGGVEKVIPIA